MASRRRRSGLRGSSDGSDVRRPSRRVDAARAAQHAQAGPTREVFASTGAVPAAAWNLRDSSSGEPPEDPEDDDSTADCVRVYVAENHPVFLQGMVRTVQERATLELAGHAADGREALEEIADLQPDVTVLDVRMPGLDGPEILDALHLRGIETRVVFLSAMMDQDVVYAAIAGGASAYLSKHSTPDEICDVIEAVARGETVIPAEVQAGLIRHIRERAQAVEPSRPRPRLTQREQEVLALIAEGCSAPQIGRRLYLSPATVKTHMKHLYKKLGVSDRAAATAVAMRDGLID